MLKTSFRTLLCLNLSLVLPLVMPARLPAAPETAFFVSPAGSDANDGKSPTTPFATLTKARDAVRTANADMRGDIVVQIMKGDYLVSETITFNDQDSGRNGFNVIYKNHGSTGSARFIGGAKVTGWTAWKDHIWQAHVGPDLAFTTLYENCIRADLARWPKRTSPFATSRAGYMTQLEGKGGCHFVDTAPSPEGAAFDPADKDFSNAWIYYWDGGDGHRWSSGNKPVRLSKPLESDLIPLKNGGIGSPCNSFLIEGCLGLLTRPGEFFYDKKTGTLYYYSRFSGPIKSEVVIPKLVRLLSVVGSSDSRLAQHIRFEGLAFLGTDRIPENGTGDWTDSQQPSWDAAVYLKNAQNITIQNCRIADTGINGITADSNTRGCTVAGCLIEHTGFHGLSLINGESHAVSNCRIRYISELRGHGDGVSIMCDPKRPDGKSTSAAFCAHTLSNLEIYYVARAGVAIRGRNDVVQYVKVHDCVQDSGDQGGFYMVDPAINTTVSQCTSFHHYVDLSCMDRPPTAVYNDRDAVNTAWSNIDAGDSQMFIFRHDPQKEGTLTFNNVNWDPTCNPRHNEVRNTPNPAFDKRRMEYSKIGITADFPAEYDDSDAIPAAPLNLWAQTGNGQADLDWTEVDHATNYTIKRGTASGGPYTAIGSSAVPTTGWKVGTSYTDTGLTNDTSYYYVVTATNAAGESSASLELKVTPNPNGSNRLRGTTIGKGGNAGLAFDGNLKSYFDSPGGWTGLDLGRPCVITEIRYSPRSDNTDTTARMARGEFQGANDPDFTNPLTLYIVLGTKGGAGTPVLIPQTIFNRKSFRYVRYMGPSGKSLVAEIEFHGYPSYAGEP